MMMAHIANNTSHCFQSQESLVGCGARSTCSSRLSIDVIGWWACISAAAMQASCANSASKSHQANVAGR